MKWRETKIYFKMRMPWYKNRRNFSWNEFIYSILVDKSTCKKEREYGKKYGLPSPRNQRLMNTCEIAKYNSLLADLIILFMPHTGRTLWISRFEGPCFYKDIWKQTSTYNFKKYKKYIKDLRKQGYV